MNVELMNQCRATVLKNGLTVVTSSIPTAQSVAIGMFLGVGGRYEKPSLAGASHFLEHMLFKGTPTRSALDISEAIEGRGGYLNAYTSEDDTCFYVRMPFEDMDMGVDILADMYLHALIDDGEFLRERDVILEEIKMYDDQPAQAVQDNFERAFYQNHPLGTSLAGDEKTLGALTPEKLRAYKNKSYVPSATVFALAGNLDHEACVKAVEKRVGAVRKARAHRFRPLDDKTRQDAFVMEHRAITQSQAILGFRTVGRNDPTRYAVQVLRCILGDNMSSRLFQKVRERHGLCYSITASTQAYDETGIFAISLGADPQKTSPALRLIAKELKKVTQRKIPANELKRAKEYLIGTRRLSLESNINQMIYLGDHYLYFHTLPDANQRIAALKQVTADQILEVANRLFQPERMTLSLMLPESDQKTETEWLSTLDALR